MYLLNVSSYPHSSSARPPARTPASTPASTPATTPATSRAPAASLSYLLHRSHKDIQIPNPHCHQLSKLLRLGLLSFLDPEQTAP